MEDPPTTPDLEKLMRFLMTEKPRITHFEIDWDMGKENRGNFTNGVTVGEEITTDKPKMEGFGEVQGEGFGQPQDEYQKERAAMFSETNVAEA